MHRRQKYDMMEQHCDSKALERFREKPWEMNKTLMKHAKKDIPGGGKRYADNY